MCRTEYFNFDNVAQYQNSTIERLILGNIDKNSDFELLQRAEAEIQPLPVSTAAILDNLPPVTPYSIGNNNIDLLVLENMEKDIKFASLSRVELKAWIC